MLDLWAGNRTGNSLKNLETKMNQQDVQTSYENYDSYTANLANEEIEAVSTHVKKVIRRRMHTSMKSQFDSVDFMQMAWASLLSRGCVSGPFQNIEHLKNYVTSVARNKVGEVYRQKFQYQKRNVGYETQLVNMDVDELEVDLTETPSAITVMREFWLKLEKLCNSRELRVITRKVEGYSNQEIGVELGVHARTVRKILSRIAATLGV